MSRARQRKLSNGAFGGATSRYVTVKTERKRKDKKTGETKSYFVSKRAQVQIPRTTEQIDAARKRREAADKKGGKA